MLRTKVLTFMTLYWYWWWVGNASETAVIVKKKNRWTIWRVKYCWKIEKISDWRFIAGSRMGKFAYTWSQHFSNLENIFFFLVNYLKPLVPINWTHTFYCLPFLVILFNFVFNRKTCLVRCYNELSPSRIVGWFNGKQQRAIDPLKKLHKQQQQ